MKTDWNATDAVALRQFLLQNPKFLRILQSSRPKIDGATVESRAMTGSDVKGYDQCLDNIERLTDDPMSSESAGYVEEA